MSIAEIKPMPSMPKIDSKTSQSFFGAGKLNKSHTVEPRKRTLHSQCKYRKAPLMQRAEKETECSNEQKDKPHFFTAKETAF